MRSLKASAVRSESSFRNLLYWSKLQRTPRFYAWAGVSFEILAMNHIDQVKQRLGISGVATQLYSMLTRYLRSSQVLKIGYSLRNNSTLSSDIGM